MLVTVVGKGGTTQFLLELTGGKGISMQTSQFLTFIKNSNSLLVLLFIAVYFVVVFVKRNDNLQILIKILGKTVIVADFPSIFMKNVFRRFKKLINCFILTSYY